MILVVYPEQTLFQWIIAWAILHKQHERKTCPDLRRFRCCCQLCHRLWRRWHCSGLLAWCQLFCFSHLYLRQIKAWWWGNESASKHIKRATSSESVNSGKAHDRRRAIVICGYRRHPPAQYMLDEAAINTVQNMQTTSKSRYDEDAFMKCEWLNLVTPRDNPIDTVSNNKTDDESYRLWVSGTKRGLYPSSVQQESASTHEAMSTLYIILRTLNVWYTCL